LRNADKTQKKIRSLVMKTAYVTGATGFLGRNLVNELIGQQWSVVVLHRKTSDLRKLKGCGVRFQEVDLHSLESVRSSISGQVDAIFHAAANTSHWSEDAPEQWKDNVLATRNLVKVALEKEVRRLIFTSTWATHPYEDTDERAANRIDVPYIRTKRLSELEVYRGIEQGLDAVIMQPTVLIGAYDYNGYSQIFSLMQQRRPEVRMVLPGKITFCDARNVVRAHRVAFERGRRGEHYALGGTYTAWLDTYRRVAKLLGVTPPKRTTPLWLFFAAAYGSAAISRIFRHKPVLTPALVKLIKGEPEIPASEKEKSRQHLGYEPASLDEMLRDCYEWMVAEGLLKPPAPRPKSQAAAVKWL
jgi:nucleoside-diphosphate-sugar epimerase